MTFPRSPKSSAVEDIDPQRVQEATDRAQKMGVSDMVTIRQADLVLERLDQMGVEEALGKLGVDAG